MTWLEANIIAVVGWLGAILGLAFLFGRRFSRLEATDARLTETVATLSLAMAQMTESLHATAQAHDVRLTRLEEARASVDERLHELSAQISEIARDIKELAALVNRVDARCAVAFRQGGQDGGKT